MQGFLADKWIYVLTKEKTCDRIPMLCGCGGIGSIVVEAPLVEDEARRGWRSGQNSSAPQAEKNFGHRKSHALVRNEHQTN